MAKYYKLNEEEARLAHEMNSMREFRSDEPDYREKVDAAYRLAEKAAANRPAIEDKVMGMADRYSRKLADWLNEGYRIESMCPSVMISGPANFPTGKKRKQNARRDSHNGEYKAIEAIMRDLKRYAAGREAIKSSDDDAVEQLQSKLEAMEETQDGMKKANAYYRKHKTLDGYDGPYADAARESLKANASWYGDDWKNLKPFLPYALSNNNANIRRTRKRIEELQAIKSAPTGEEEAEIMGEAVTIERDGDDARLRIRFDGKPSEEIRTELKRNGFRWSPRNTAWQRQLTQNAEHSLKRLMSA